jgi:hypothetical protein
VAFALWLDGESAWAAGTHEYRPLGVAVVAATDVFRARDFDPRRPRPSAEAASFQGLFASLSQVNAHLRAGRGGNSAKRSQFRLNSSRINI